VSARPVLRPLLLVTPVAVALTAILLRSTPAAPPAPRLTPPAASVMDPTPSYSPKPAAPALPAPVPTPDNPNADYGKAFDAIWQALETRFYDETLGVLNDKAARDVYRSRAVATAPGDNAAFARLVNEMLARLNASHTRLFTAEDFEFYLLPALFGPEPRNRTGGATTALAFRARGTTLPELRHIGAMTRPDSGEPGRVLAVLNGSPAALVGIRPGDAIMAVDGGPYRGLSQFASRRGSSSGGAPETVSLVYRRGDKTRTVRVSPVVQNPLAALLEASRRSITTWNLPGSSGRRIGYVRLWSMADERFARLLEETVRGPLHSTDGLVLDLRDGYGGKAEGFADVFFRPDVAEWRRERGGTRTRRPGDPVSDDTLNLNAKGGHIVHTGYDKPMVVLTNRGTRSAKEMLAWTLQRGKRATLVGEQTAGAVLASTGTRIGDDFYLILAVQDLALDGQRLEGRGVPPDVSLTVPLGDESAWQKEATRLLAPKLGVPSAEAATAAALLRP